MLSPQDILGPEGRIDARMKHYEHRPEQLAMAEAVGVEVLASHERPKTGQAPDPVTFDKILADLHSGQ